MVNEPRVQEETDVASVLASMAALSNFCESSLTIQTGDGVMGGRLLNQHSVETLLRGSRESSISSNSSSSANPLGMFFDTNSYCSDVTLCPPAVTIYAPDSDLLRAVTVSLPSLHQTGNQQEPTVSLPLHKQHLGFSHHSSPRGQTEADVGITMPRKKSSSEEQQPPTASPPRRLSPHVSTPRQSEPATANSTEQRKLPLQKCATDHSIPPAMPASSTSQLPSSMASSPPQLVASRGCGSLSSMNETSVPSRGRPCRRVESIPGDETGEEPLQSPAKRRKTVRSSNRIDKAAPLVAATSPRIPPLIMADPEAVRIDTSISPNEAAVTLVPALATSPAELQPLTTHSSETTAPSSRTTDDHAPLQSPAFPTANGGPWLNSGAPMDRIHGDATAPTPTMHNPAQDNVMRFHRRLVKFKRSSKECHRLLDATATAETETGRYVWFGSPQGMRLIIDSTNRLARNLESLTAHLEEALEAVCSSQKAIASGIVLPPLPPVTDSPPTPPVNLTSSTHTLAPGMSHASTVASCHSSVALPSGGDHWVGLSNLTQGRNVLGELSVDIDTLAMLIRTPRLRSAERELPGSSGSETPKKYILSSKGMLESEPPTRSKKKSSSQRTQSEVDKLIQWPKHVTGAVAGVGENDGQRARHPADVQESTRRQLNDIVRRRLTSDLGPNWKLDKPVGQKRATSESAQARIKLASEMDHCSEDYELELLNEAPECRKDRCEEMPRSSSVTSVASDATIIDDDEAMAKEQTGSNPPGAVAVEQLGASTDTLKEFEKVDSAETENSEKAEESCDTPVVSDSPEVKLKNKLYDDIDAATGSMKVERNVSSTSVANKFGKSSQESNKTKGAQASSGGKSGKSRKRPRETGDGKKDAKNVTKSRKSESGSKVTPKPKSKRPVGRPRIYPTKKTSVKTDSKVRAVGKVAGLKPKPVKQRLKKAKAKVKDVRLTEMDLEQERGPGGLLYLLCCSIH